MSSWPRRHEDIALVFLDTEVAGVTPAPIADADYLASLDLTSETFTVVGYGTDAYITGSAFADHPVVLFDGIRSYRDVSVITEHDLFPDQFLKITAGVCFGDSGGPLFHEDTVVALNSWTFSARCAGRTWSTGSTPRQHRSSCGLPVADGVRRPAGLSGAGRRTICHGQRSLMSGSLDLTPSRMARSRHPDCLYRSNSPEDESVRPAAGVRGTSSSSHESRDQGMLVSVDQVLS